MNPLDREGYPFIWSAFLFQSAANPPTLTGGMNFSSINTFLGGEPVHSRVNVGIYRMVFTNPVLTLGLTFFYSNPGTSDSYPVARIDASTVEWRHYVLPTNVLSDNGFFNLMVVVIR